MRNSFFLQQFLQEKAVSHFHDFEICKALIRHNWIPQDISKKLRSLNFLGVKIIALRSLKDLEQSVISFTTVCIYGIELFSQILIFYSFLLVGTEMLSIKLLIFVHRREIDPYLMDLAKARE
ncbi:hypothetical protein EDC96DRAFT_540486 [Choanephora cucurbitarum]|nr:hypothetical protein EDC96DRAFT_540486 [Choanephora cucurbitarum]